MKTLNRGFGRYPLEELGPRVRVIITSLTNSPDFPDPQPKASDVEAKLEVFERALAMPPGQAREQALSASQGSLRETLNKLADNLEDTPGATDVTLATTGFELRKDAVRTDEPPPIPANVRLKHSPVSGVVQVLFEPSARGKAYQVEWTLTPEGPWQDGGVFSSSRGVGIGGLTRGKDIWVRVRALGPSNIWSGWGEPATIVGDLRTGRVPRANCSGVPMGRARTAFFARWRRRLRDSLWPVAQGRGCRTCSRINEPGRPGVETSGRFLLPRGYGRNGLTRCWLTAPVRAKRGG